MERKALKHALGRTSGGRFPRSNRGFTLIEIGAVLVVVCILMGVAVPTIRNISGVQARTEVGKLASNLRAARGHAAVSGSTCRMVFDLNGDSYGLECAKGNVQIGKETSRNGQRDDVDPFKGKNEKDLTESEKMKLKLMRKNAFSADPSLQTQRLKGNLQFVSLWTPHQEEAYTKGKGYMYFFPSGYTEASNIVLKFGDDFYTIQTSPLAGHVKILGDKFPPAVQTNDDW